MRRSGSVLVAVLAVAAMSGCGRGEEGAVGGDSGGETGGTDVDAAEGGGQPLTFVAADIEYSSSPSTASAGQATLVLENQGELEHYVVIDDLAFEVEAEGGQTAEGTVDLGPGTYTYYCKMPGHREAGMEGQLVVS
jgi:uncharacterized cupredoxin-like copper-binding protein